MNHAGTPPHRKEDCRDHACQWHGTGSWKPLSSLSPVVLDAASTSTPLANRPLQAARADAAETRDNLPFMLQSGRTMFLVAGDANGWVVAELEFEPGACAFVERSRAWFEWPREAFGRLLSRLGASTPDDQEALNEVDADFRQWLASEFAG